MRKAKLLMLLTLAMSVGLNAQEKEEGKIVLQKIGTEAVPGVVVSSVTADYPDATVTEYNLIPVTIYQDQWAVTDVEDNRKEGDEINHYVVILKGDNVNGQAIYDAEGNLLQFKAKIKNEQLPEPIMNYIEKNYSDWAITEDKEIVKLSPRKAIDYYKVKIKKGKKDKVLFLTPDGEVIKER
jgi:hypothetical protein